MSAAICVTAADAQCSAATLSGTFDRSNRWFLDKHLDELDGNVVLDCRDIERLDDWAVDTLLAFRDRAASQRRRVVFDAVPTHYRDALDGGGSVRRRTASA